MPYSKKIQLGLVGCGRISKNHFNALKKLDDRFHLKAVCDIDTKRFDKLDELGVCAERYTDYEKMLREHRFDLVTLCTPSGLHPEHGILAAKHKASVLSEKPMATTLEAADRLIAECDKQKVKLFVVKQNRLNPTVMHLKRAIAMGRFGRIYQVLCNVFWTRPQSYYDMDAWRGRRGLGGGAFLNQASHYVDLLYHLIGDVKSVSAIARTLERKIEVEDSGVAVFEFKNGVIGSMNTSMLVFPKNYEGSVTVIGEKGLVRIGGVAVNKIEKWEFAEYHDMDREVADVNYEVTSVYGNGHETYYRELAEHFSGKGGNHVDGLEGRKSLEMIMAIYRSSETGKTVYL